MLSKYDTEACSFSFVIMWRGGIIINNHSQLISFVLIRIFAAYELPKLLCDCAKKCSTETFITIGLVFPNILSTRY
jgi:hypothetical protein